MKVKELIDILGDFDPELEVHISYNYGDHWRTEVAPAVTHVGDGKVTYSEYHRMDKVEESYDPDEGFEEEEASNARNVLLIG